MFNIKRLEKSMQALKNGDNSSFNIIYEETYRLVYYVIYSILKSKEDSEDILQDTYMKVCEKIELYDSAPKAWITTIAKNLAINRYNKNKHSPKIYLEDNISKNFYDKTTETPLIDLAAKILDQDEFSIVMLCVVEGYKRREVAKLFNLSTSGVTWKLDKALEKLRKEANDEN